MSLLLLGVTNRLATNGLAVDQFRESIFNSDALKYCNVVFCNYGKMESFRNGMEVNINKE